MLVCVLLIFLLVGLLLSSAFFSSSEVALFSLSAPKVRGYKGDPNPRYRLIARLLASPRDLLVTLLFFNILINILIQNVISSLFGELSGWVFNVGVPLVLTLIFGEILPKSIGLAHNAALAEKVVPVLSILERYTGVFRKALIGVTSAVSRVLFFFLRPEEEISGDELQYALKASFHCGVLNADEAELIRGYLLLQEAQVRELMRPREDVLFYSLDEPLSRLIHLFVDQQCSRIPVCTAALDDVIGIMTSQLYFVHRDVLKQSSDLIPLLRKPFYAPEGMYAETLLIQLYESQESLSLVVDEYGSISGLIALEDLVEVVVGEIADARDATSRYSRSGEDVIIASGKMELSEFEEVFAKTLLSENNRVTVGGWLIEQVGDIPKSGSKYILQGFLFHILAADLKRISRMYIRKLKVHT